MIPAGKALARFVKISPYKARKVIALVKGKDVASAFAILENTDKRSANLLRRLLRSAVASAMKAGKFKQEEFYISKIVADDGPMMRRYRAAAMGRATMIRKRTSHLSIELDRIGVKKKVK